LNILGALLLERHQPECKGLLKTPTKTELAKEGENKMAFKNYHKQMKSPYVVYADFECVLKKYMAANLHRKQALQ